MRQTDVPFYGVAFPGTYLLDGDGIVTAKFFHRHMAMRTSAETLLDAATDRLSLADATPRASATTDGAHITVALRGGGGVIRMASVRELVVRIEVDEGLELDTSIVDPQGPGTHVSVVGPQGFHAEAPIQPPTSEGRRRGTVDYRIPVWASSEVVGITAPPRSDSIRFDVAISLQLRDKAGRTRPIQTLRIGVDAPVGTHLVPDLPGINATGHRVVAMDSERHFQRLLRRAACEGEN
jgi:hypothetical protein